MVEMPDILRALAGDLEEWTEKLGSRSETRGDVLNPKHDLIHWREHSPLVLEVVGSGRKRELCAIRVEGRVIDEYLKDGLWDEAEEWLADTAREAAQEAREEAAERRGDEMRERHAEASSQ